MNKVHRSPTNHPRMIVLVGTLSIMRVRQRTHPYIIYTGPKQDTMLRPPWLPMVCCLMPCKKMLRPHSLQRDRETNHTSPLTICSCFLSSSSISYHHQLVNHQPFLAKFRMCCSFVHGFGGRNIVMGCCFDCCQVQD